MARNADRYDEATDISGYDPLEGLLDGGDDGMDVDPEDVLSEADTEEVEVEEEEQEEEPVQQQVQQPQPYNPNADPNVAWARARVLERERDTYRKRLDLIISELQKQQTQQPEEEEEELEFLAPDEKAAKISEKTLRKIEALENQQKLTKQQQMLQQAIGVADAYIANFAVANPQYTQAIAHLAAVELDEFLDENPELTQQEAEAKIMGKVQSDKLRWLQAGKHPGVELWKRAVRRGFNPQAMEQYMDDADEPVEAPVKQKQPAQDEVEQVKRKREKQQASKTISTVQGAQGRSSLNAKSLAKMSEKDFLDKIADLTKDTPGRRVPSFAELLPGKGYRDRPS